MFDSIVQSKITVRINSPIVDYLQSNTSQVSLIIYFATLLYLKNSFLKWRCHWLLGGFATAVAFG